MEWLDEMAWSPAVATILNISPNHLDRHGTFERYRDAKGLILAHQKAGDTAILVSDPPGSAYFRDRVKGRLLWVGATNRENGITLDDGWIAEVNNGAVTRIFDSGALIVPGRHNVLNAMSAAACARSLFIGHEAIEAGLASFRGVPHRIQYLGERESVRFYNDSKATTPESTVVAVESFPGRVIPILGGYDKHVSFDHMAEEIRKRVDWAALIGVTADQIRGSLDRAGIAYEKFPTLKAAFEGCVAHARPGDVVLLSPGCASYDMFNDYEQRGEIFMDMVEEYLHLS
jgi:UDP-N-acetylmuramoylalanine--D-glutamate ligase